MPTQGQAIHPPSSFWRTVLFILIGILVILAILYYQGKWDPQKWDPRKRKVSMEQSGISYQQSAFSQAQIAVDL
jgi:hypothetical protein